MSITSHNFPEVSFQLTREELIESQMYILNSSRASRGYARRALAWLLVTPVIFVAAAMVPNWPTVRSGGIGPILRDLSPFILLYMAFVGWEVYHTFGAKKRAITRTVDSDKTDLYYAPRTVKLTDEGLEEDTQYTCVQVKWLGVSHVAENEKYIFLYITNNNAHIIPKRAFATPEHARRFYDFALQHCSTMGQCPKCNYDLRGNTTRICPECGTSVAAPPAPA